MFRNFLENSKRTTDILIYFIFLSATFFVMRTCLDAGFLAYDDQHNILANSYLHDQEYLRFWVKPYMGLFIPVIYTVWTFLHSLFGLDPAIYHGLNVFIHAMNGYLIFLICRQMKLSVIPAIFAGALFLFHPIQVEAVAWVTGTKDTLSFMFCLISIWLWLRPTPTTLSTWGLIIFSSLAVLSKPTAIALPISLILYSLAMKSDLSIKKIFPLCISFLVALYTVTTSYYAPHSTDTTQLTISFSERFIILFDSLGFYITKLFVPLDFYPDYARPLHSVLKQKLYGTNVLVGAVTTGLWLYLFSRFYKQKNRIVLLCLFLSAIFFAPVSGFITFNYQVTSTTADRYFYPIMASIAILVAYGYSLIQALSPAMKRFAASGLIVVLALSSFFQSQIWKNDAVFFEYLLEGNPDNFHANNNLAVFSQLKGDYKTSIQLFKKASLLNPRDMNPVTGLMISFAETGQEEQLNELVNSYCHDDQLKRMKLTPSVFAAFRICADVYRENKKTDLALMFYCRTSLQSPAAKMELETLIADKQQQLNKTCDSYPPLQLMTVQFQ